MSDDKRKFEWLAIGLRADMTQGSMEGIVEAKDAVEAIALAHRTLVSCSFRAGIDSITIKRVEE